MCGAYSSKYSIMSGRRFETSVANPVSRTRYQAANQCTRKYRLFALIPLPIKVIQLLKLGKGFVFPNRKESLFV